MGASFCACCLKCTMPEDQQYTCRPTHLPCRPEDLQTYPITMQTYAFSMPQVLPTPHLNTYQVRLIQGPASLTAALNFTNSTPEHLPGAADPGASFCACCLRLTSSSCSFAKRAALASRRAMCSCSCASCRISASACSLAACKACGHRASVRIARKAMAQAALSTSLLCYVPADAASQHLPAAWRPARHTRTHTKRSHFHRIKNKQGRRRLVLSASLGYIQAWTQAHRR